MSETGPAANNALSTSTASDSTAAAMEVEGATGSETATTSVAAGGTKVVPATKATTSNVRIVKNAGNLVQAVSASTASTPTKDNIIVVVNKVEGGTASASSGEVNVVSKPLTIVGSPGAAILKTGAMAGKTIVKVQKASPQGAANLVGKRNIVVATRAGGGNQIIMGAPVQVQQQPSTPVILTQKVAAGGVVASPVVSTGGVNAAITNVQGGAKFVTAISPTSPTLPQQKLQDVRVDNWGNYCLQRLQNMYDKGDYCDLTLRFHSSQEIKVHRVVVNLCTEYFSNLEKLYGLSEGTLILPKDVEYPTMQTIIKFFYTGKLEVRGAQFNDIYRTVKMMNITILIKLLEAHSRKPVTQVKKEAGRSVVLKQAVDLGKGQKGQVQLQVASSTGQGQSTSPVIALSGSKALQVATPGVKLPPGVKTKTVLARVQAQSPKSSGQTAKPNPKKLPIWKERKFTPSTPDPPPQLEKWQIKEEEPARPTRFEWGDPDDFLDPFMSSSTLNTNHALMEKQKERHSVNRKAEDIFDSVKSQNQSQKAVKRTQSESASSNESTEPPAAKVPRLDQETEEQILPDIDTNVEPNEEIIASEYSENEPSTSTIVQELKPAVKKPLKPALKSPKPSGTASDGSPTKTVRFAPDVGKDDDTKTTSTPPASTTSTPTLVPVTSASSSASATVSAASTSPSTSTTSSITLSNPSKLDANTTATVETSDALVNHSKIISEVLRKFPDLVKDNKNIKLKIVQKPADNTSAGGSKETKSKVQYIVLKSTGMGEGTASTVLKKTPGQSSVSKFWETEKTQKKPSPAENTTGPWLCETCGEGENSALQFDTYYNFRRHLVDVHGERIDARICEYCGQKASKRNLLLYHLYTKHGVQPPKNCTFPHCDRCDYVALSESLLNKHKQNHDVNKEFSCSICNASFKSNQALQSHMSANLHRNKDTKVYECPYCRKPFVRNINLKAHIRSLHRDVARIEEMEDPRLPPDESLKMFAGVGNRRRQFPSILTGARTASNAGMVEFVTADSFTDGQTVSYVTADGQPIEILDPSALSALPLTLVSSGEDGMAAVATPITTTVGMDGQTTSATTEFVTSISQDNSQAMYVMDSSQGAMEIDMSNMGLTVGPDGSVVFDGDDGSQNYIVQDMQGNQFRRITGIDETGKPVVFLQMINDGTHVEMAPTMLDENMQVDGNPANSQMFVSSAGMQIPVSSEGSDGQQVIFTSASNDGTILEMVPSDEGSHQVVVSEAVLSAHDQQLGDQQQHLQLVQHDNDTTMQEVIHDQMGQPVQELHIVLDQQENRSEGHDQAGQQDGMEIVEVQQSESYDEIQLASIQQVDHAEGSSVNTESSGGANANEEHDTEIITDSIEEAETQHVEVDESSQQLQIDEAHSHSLDMDSQETQVVTEENLEESIELVEGQTLTLIEEEDGTQTLKVSDGNVEESSS